MIFFMVVVFGGKDTDPPAQKQILHARSANTAQKKETALFGELSP